MSISPEPRPKSHDEVSQEGLQRGMTQRQIQMLAIGGVIGVGLFYGASLSVKLAGPAVIIDFVICGLIVAIVMRALAEMTSERPISGSFSTYARDMFGPGIGFVTAGMWWFFWVTTVMSELAAIGKLMEYWFPALPAWVPGAVALVLFTFSNLLVVKIFGEIEYWFAVLKVLAVSVFIVFGILVIATGFANGGHIVGISNLWVHGGFMPNGILGVVMAISLTVQAYSGVETLAVESGETKNPERAVRRAFNTLTLRIAVLYVGSIFIMLCVFPWDAFASQSASPYVLLFSKIGIPIAAGIVNLIIVLSGLSSCNTGLYGGSRMLFGTARGNVTSQPESKGARGKVAPVLTKLNSRRVPYVAVWATAACIAIGILITYLAPNNVYVWITSASAFADLWVWGIILASEMKFRKQANATGQKLSFPVPLWPATPILGLVLVVAAFIAIVVSPITRISVFSGVLFLVILLIWAGISSRRRRASQA